MPLCESRACNLSKLLAAKGWQVGIAGRRIERLQALISQSGITSYQQIDGTSPDAPAQLLELIDKLGGMDLYFHSSGIGWQNNSLDIEKELKDVYKRQIPGSGDECTKPNGS